jgi:hypothetical protein
MVGGQGWQMAQTMYAHMNKWIIKKTEKNSQVFFQRYS